MNNPGYPRVKEKKVQELSRWLNLTERQVIFAPDESPETYHSVRPHDYVSVLAVTSDGRLPLVRQYRPTLESFSLELPGGLLDSEEGAEKTALRELREETGLLAEKARCLGLLIPDPGRLENRFYCYFVENARGDAGFNQESRIEVVWTTPQDLKEMILAGEFTNSLHIALFGIAYLQGLILTQT